jgi:transcriptional regulator with XRE-family HTH domain
LIGLALHADWSTDPRKRWMTLAEPLSRGWHVQAATPVGPLDKWLYRLRAQANGGAVALGVDLPLGLPRDYAVLHAQAADFVGFLRDVAARGDFFSVCATLDELRPDRPFYPARGIAGMTRAAHAQALGLAGPSGLSRLCDRATRLRPAGAPLFWTLGANQTGKAAITAWRDVLLPALSADAPLRLWPFEGGFAELLAPGYVVMAETYPAESMRQRGLILAGSKRRQADRAGLAAALLGELEQRRATPSAALLAEIRDGFGADASGEDRFDSLLGLLGLLAVIDGGQPDFVPDDPLIRQWEGWVLGQTEMPQR